MWHLCYTLYAIASNSSTSDSRKNSQSLKSIKIVDVSFHSKDSSASHSLRCCSRKWCSSANFAVLISHVFLSSDKLKSEDPGEHSGRTPPHYMWVPNANKTKSTKNLINLSFPTTIKSTTNLIKLVFHLTSLFPHPGWCFHFPIAYQMIPNKAPQKRIFALLTFCAQLLK